MNKIKVWIECCCPYCGQAARSTCCGENHCTDHYVTEDEVIGEVDYTELDLTVYELEDK